MSETWQTILLSLATSLIVSLVTFILGLKSGKNQADRAKLQNMYRDLYSHFSNLKNCLIRNQPRTWTNYKKIEQGFYRMEYYPPVKELKRTGDILFLKEKIADEALKLEMQAMNYPSELSRHIPEIHAAIISDLGIYKEGYTFRKYQGRTDDTSHFETANPKNCNTFSPLSYHIFFNPKEVLKLFQQMDSDTSTALEFTSGGNPTAYSAKIYPGGIIVSGSEYAEHLLAALGKNVAGYNQLCNQRDTLILQIDKLNKKLQRKAKEPIGFWETLLGAFADMFH